MRLHYGQWQARVSAGIDPATGERIILHETLATEREAEKALTRLLAEADAVKTARTKASFGFLLDRWFPQHEVGPSTRATYESLLRNHIRPALGTVSLTKLVICQRLGLSPLTMTSTRRCTAAFDGRVLAAARACRTKLVSSSTATSSRRSPVRTAAVMRSPMKIRRWS